MSQQAAVTRRKLRTDTRLLDDIVYGLDGYWAILVAHDLKLFPLLAEQPRTLQEVSEALRIARRPAEALLTVCLAQGLLQNPRPSICTDAACRGLSARKQPHLLRCGV